MWRRNRERFAECCVKQRDRWVGGSVLVWGGITADNRTQLHVLDRSINALTYRDQILAPIVLPFLRRHLPYGVFQHDNARPHITRLCTHYLQTNNIVVLDWPLFLQTSPPIEYLWDELGRRVYLGTLHQPTSMSYITHSYKNGNVYLRVPSERSYGR